MAPFNVGRCDVTGETIVFTWDSPELALADRDRRNEKIPHGAKVIVRVTDADDAERGEAEWCESCGERAFFGDTGLCPSCQATDV